MYVNKLRTPIILPTVLMVVCGLLWTATGQQANSDVLKMKKGEVEGRILENSARVLVVETIAGEYVVIAKTQVDGIQEESEPEFYFRRARLHENDGNDKRALVDYLETLNRAPEHQKAKQGIQKINYRKKKAQWDEGMTVANQHLDNQEYNSALTAFQNVLTLQPEETLARLIVRKMSATHERLAFLYYDHCMDQEAIVELAKAEELNPSSAEIYYILGRIHETDRKFDLARLEFERALEMDPDHSSARRHLTEVIEEAQRRRDRLR